MGKRVLVSRGELVEIGGGFRVPEVLARSGAVLAEVGTTNKTRLADYEAELSRGEVGAILRVHQGNFRQAGFVERPSVAALAALARSRGVPLVEDLGGGALVDLAAHGLAGEPTPMASLEAGVSVVCFSTDKALGGPQGGALVGAQTIVERARRDPLARALRMGRLPLVALEETLRAYLEGRAFAEVPALAAVSAPLADVRARAERWQASLEARLARPPVEVVSLEVEMGGGTLADVPLSSAGLAVSSADVEGLAARLRAGTPAVMARVHEGRLLLDARTVLPHEDQALLDALVAALAS
jgi:L-seryl-tRNA(Ser) seleniumtransferase